MSQGYPIILAHGIARFDELSDRLFRWRLGGRDDGLHYFRNIRSHLQSHGFRVYHSRVEWAAKLPVRAKTLAENIRRVLALSNSEHVHIIAHSSGGLDARQMLYDHRAGLADNVASLVTIATPHHGSPAADVLANALGKAGRAFGIDARGFSDLTTEACARFNAEKWPVERKSHVYFRTYAGAQNQSHVFAPLKPLWSIIDAREGRNDGLVSVQSAAWRKEFFAGSPEDADHLNLIGWWDPAELRNRRSPFELEAQIKELYLSIAKHLEKRF